MKQFDFENIRMIFDILKRRVSKVYFILVKLPLMLFAIVAGFIFEFILELPFILLIAFGYRSKKNKDNFHPNEDGQLILQNNKN